MKGWQWLVAILVALIAVGVLWYRYGHQKIRLATDAEIRAVVPAGLLPQGPPDPAAVRRFLQLVELCNHFHLAPGQRFASAAPDPAFMAENAVVASDCMKLIRQGVAAQDASSWIADDFGLDVLINTLTLEAKLRGKMGDSQGCETALAACLEVGRGMGLSGGDFGGYAHAIGALDKAAEATENCVRRGWLNPLDMRNLAKAVPENDLIDDDLVVALKTDLQRVEFDPHGGVAAEARRVADSAGQSFEDAYVGNYDTLQTAKLLADLYGEEIANAKRHWTADDYTEESRIGNLVSEIPQIPRASTSIAGLRTSTPTRFEELRYRMAMNAIPNSHALELLKYVRLNDARLRARGLETANELDILRLLLAVWTYKEEHSGNFPDSAEVLVNDRYLPRAGVGTLLYNPRARTITSRDGAGQTPTLDIAPLPSQ